MNNIKKIGLSALAGSLVAFSANAAELSVSGGVEITYNDTGGNSGNEVTGNSYGANSNMTFTGSGDVGFGEVTMTRAINDTNGGWASSWQTLDMGDMGTISFDSTGVSGSGISGSGSTNVIGYANSFGPIALSAGYSQLGSSTAESATSGAGSHGSISDVSVTVSGLVDGLTVQAGYAENSSVNTSITSEDTTEVVGHILYSTGPVSVGYRLAEVNAGTASTASKSIEAYSIAFNVNDNFAISYGVQDTEKEAISATASVTEDVTGISAAYTVGAASVRLMHNKSSDDNNVVGADDEQTEVSLVLSF
jgi:outer membrane protein OmpU